MPVYANASERQTKSRLTTLVSAVLRVATIFSQFNSQALAILDTAVIIHTILDDTAKNLVSSCHEFFLSLLIYCSGSTLLIVD